MKRSMMRMWVFVVACCMCCTIGLGNMPASAESEAQLKARKALEEMNIKYNEYAFKDALIEGNARVAELFLDAGMEATPEMRRVRFSFWDRFVLIPIEFRVWAKYGAIIALAFLLLSGLGRDIYSFTRIASVGLPSLALFVAAYLAGVALMPALLPWLPGRSFSVKGAAAGLLVVLSLAGANVLGGWLGAIAWVVIIPTVASFLGMNFTGASTYTSLSGVRREMRVAVPVQTICAIVGGVLWLVARFV